MFKYISWFVATVAISYGVFLTYYIYKVPDMPRLDQDLWWGKEPRPKEEDTSIRPFKIEFNDTVIIDLKQRIKNRRPLTRPLDGIQSEYGINTIYLENLLTYWAEKYDFKKRAELLNRFPHYKTKIQGLDIQFIRVKPSVKNVKVLPLLMLHGWPSSSKEFDKIIPILTTPKYGYNFVFEVIAADLPGFGFSEGTSKPGLNPVQIGIMMRNLMKRLGFNKFYVHAGDWGSQAATHMVTIFPDEVTGFHTNMPLSASLKSGIKILLGSLAPSLTGDHYHRLYPLSQLLYLVRESGYFHLMATKPDTLGVSLTDSPTGLAAYLTEKMAVGTNRYQLDTLHGGLESLELDDVLDTVTIQWVNNCAVTSMRVYAEDYFASSPEVHELHKIPTKVPTAAIKLKYEIMWQPDWVLRDKFPNLVRSTTLDFGGHYAALEVPKELAADVFAAGAEFQKFHEANGKM
ncbi:juvenile hormone epoxide hydrolase-like isoform X1 [Cydia splendana]|uniref:juvenile hormone epoxide hydrolase-like isoform X1 n=1 Tax=Cydia splendana TaxID=1100963 RepID=UPI0021241031